MNIERDSSHLNRCSPSDCVHSTCRLFRRSSLRVSQAPVAERPNAVPADSLGSIIEDMDTPDRDGNKGIFKLCAILAEGTQATFSWEDLRDKTTNWIFSCGRGYLLTRNQNGETVLHFSCGLNNVPYDWIKFLVESGGDGLIYARDEHGRTALHHAVSRGVAQVEAVTLLIEKGGKDLLHQKDNSGNTALYVACEACVPIELLDLLVQADEESIIDFRGPREKTILSFICDSRRTHKQIPRDRMCAILDRLLDFDKENTLLRSDGVALQTLPESIKRHVLRRPDVRLWLNKTFSRRSSIGVMMLDLYAQLLLMIGISCGAIESLNNGEGRSKIFIALAIIGLAEQSIRELLQLYFTEQVYFSDPWNLLQVLQIVFVIPSVVVIQLTDSIDDTLRTGQRFILTFTVGMTWLSILGVLKDIIPGIALFVYALQEILITLVPFLFTTTMITSAFALMFYVGGAGSNDCSGDSEDWYGELSWLCSLGKTYAHTFGMLLGEVEVGVFSESDTGMATVVLYIFGFVIGLLFLNVLIAVITNSFERVESKGEHVFWRTRLNYVASLGRSQCMQCPGLIFPLSITDFLVRVDDIDGEDNLLIYFTMAFFGMISGGILWGHQLKSQWFYGKEHTKSPDRYDDAFKELKKSIEQVQGDVRYLSLKVMNLQSDLGVTRPDIKYERVPGDQRLVTWP